jgi:uncharacterized membrane protein
MSSYKYLIEPIIKDSGYNPVNTVAWALLLGFSILLIIRLFKRVGLQMDEGLVLYTLPYILAGATLRVVEDAELVAPPAKYLLITPLIYFVVAAVTIALLITTKSTLRDYRRAYGMLGILWTLFNLAILMQGGLKIPWVPLAVLFMGTLTTSALYLMRNKLPVLENKQNLIILYAHMLDASSTYIGVDLLGYSEKHVVPTLLINLIGTALVMFPLKLLVLLPVTYTIDATLKDPNLRNLTRLTLITLGLAPAVRNSLRMALGI